MVDIGELSGPKVSAEREATADSGGGQLRVAGGKMFVQARLLARNLGPLEQLESIAFEDKRRAVIRFGGGVEWRVIDEGDSLLLFAKDVENRLGRFGLVKEPLPTSQRLRRALTPAIKVQLGFVLLGLLAVWPTAWLCGLALPLGYIVGAVGLLWFCLLSLAQSQAVSERLPPFLQAPGRWGSHLVLPACLSLGAAFGAQDAHAAAAAEARAAEAARLQALQDAERAAAEQERVERVRAQANEVAKRVHAAIDAEKWREAEALVKELAALDAGHGALQPAREQIAPQIARLDEQRRHRGVAAGVRLARKLTRDHVACESASSVSRAWRLLREVQPNDRLAGSARKLVPKVESCRRVVARGIVENARRTRRAELARAVDALREQLRRRGDTARVELSGKAKDRMLVEIQGLSQARLEELLEPRDDGESAFLARFQAMGIRRMRFSNGGRMRIDRKLDPPDLNAFAENVLDGLGLKDPLVLPPGADRP